MDIKLLFIDEPSDVSRVDLKQRNRVDIRLLFIDEPSDVSTVTL